MLPLPGTPGATLSRYKASLASIFHGADPRVCLAFWLFGLINNVLYVIILSAALDLVGPSVPKGVVLLADVVPSFLTKLTAPYWIDTVPYTTRVCALVALSACGMLLIALTRDTQDAGAIAVKLCGAVLASLSSGLGELSFLGLTHYYGPFALASWGSGTGGAGLVGAGAYVLATTTIGLSVRTSLLTFAFLPAIMVVAFFGVLPLEPLRRMKIRAGAYESVEQHDDVEENGGDDESVLPEGEDPLAVEHEGLLATSMHSTRSFTASSQDASATGKFKANLRRASRLFIPYMLPLLLVYIAEYTINQGVAPTLLFPLASTPFSTYRSFYPTYNALYQTGVFLSRSSTPFLRIHNLYAPSLLQVLNLALLTAHALFDFLPSVYLVFAVVFWEGLLGGLVYVSTFAEISEQVPREDREFSLGATTVSDSAGICIAGFVGMVMEVGLCRWQVSHGRDYCRRT